jgi:hypothetical protein
MSPRLEIPSGAIDGSNRVFTTTFDYVPGSVVAHLNGQAAHINAVELGNKQFEFAVDSTPKSGDVVTVYYRSL